MPVEVGNMLEISCHPVYTGPDGSIVVVTDCSVRDYRAAAGYTKTNRMVYEFATEGDVTMPQIVPHTYSGMLGWLEGRRHYRDARNLPIDVLEW